MRVDKNPGHRNFMWSFGNYCVSFFVFCQKNHACLKCCIPEGIRKVPEGFPEGKPEGFLQ